MVIPEFSTDAMDRKPIPPALLNFIDRLSQNDLERLAVSSFNQSGILLRLKDMAMARAVEAFESGDYKEFDGATTTFETARSALRDSQALGRVAHTTLTARRFIEISPTQKK